MLYWSIGRDILEQQHPSGWGDDVVGRIAADLRATTGSARGFSRRNVFHMPRFAAVWTEPEIVQPLTAQIGWSHPRPGRGRLRGVSSAGAPATMMPSGWSSSGSALMSAAKSATVAGLALPVPRAPAPQSMPPDEAGCASAALIAASRRPSARSMARPSLAASALVRSRFAHLTASGTPRGWADADSTAAGSWGTWRPRSAELSERMRRRTA
jgi:hypothetical protein